MSSFFPELNSCTIDLESWFERFHSYQHRVDIQNSRHSFSLTPYMIKSGHIDAKLPCDASSTSPLKILVGQVGLKWSAANLTLVKPLSTPGKMCFYQADVVSQPYTHGDWLCITKMLIRNPTSTTMTFPSTSSVDIGADQITSEP